MFAISMIGLPITERVLINRINIAVFKWHLMPYMPPTNRKRNDKNTAGVNGAKESNIQTKDSIMKNDMCIFLAT